MITVALPTDLDALRIRHEFLVLPDLQASVETIAERIGVSRHHALLTLESLVSEGFLARTPAGQYVRSTGAVS
jgi:DNA-binding IclR family transcriptional regulator